jgi:hypothetical protein
MIEFLNANSEGSRIAHAFHVRELYRMIGEVRARLAEGDIESAKAICEMLEPMPPAEPSDLSPEEFAQAFEAYS